MSTVTQRRNDILMDRIYRHQRHIYDFTRKYYLLGRDRVITDLDLKADEMVLEIGCGTGRNLVKMARRYPEAHCFGLDISREMLATAETSIRRKRLEDRIRLFRGDAANFDGAAMIGQPTFDRIVISYSLSMIPPWRATLERALRALAPGGRLLLVDFGNLSGWPSWFRRSLFRWLAAFHVSPRGDLVEVAESLASARGYTVTSSHLYRGYATYIMIERPRESQSA